MDFEMKIIEGTFRIRELTTVEKLVQQKWNETQAFAKAVFDYHFLGGSKPEGYVEGNTCCCEENPEECYHY